MQKQKLKIFLFLIFFGLISAFVSHAAEPFFQVKAKKIIFHLSPDGTEHFEITCSNKGLKSGVLSWEIKADNQHDRQPAVSAKFIKFLGRKKPPFVLAPQSAKTLSFLLAPSAHILPGGYYPEIIFHFKEGKKVFTQKVKLFLDVFPARKDQSISRQGKIVSLKTPSFLFYGPFNFQITFQNQGNTFYQPSGQIVIYDIFHQPVWSMPLPKKYVLSRGKIVYHLKCPQKYFFGRYLLVARVKDGDQNLSLAAKSFWGFPWKEVGIFLIISFLIILSRKLRIKEVKYE